MRVSENILISSLTTMRLGGPARYVIEVEKPEEIPDAYEFAKTYHLPTYVLGAGANTIGHDEGFNGVIIINRIKGITDIDEYTVKAMGGENWDDVVEHVVNKNLTGIEALSKIPGLVAAAPVQNIGAYGQEVADVLTEIEVYDTKTNAFCTLSRADLKFAYRKSILNSTEKNRYFIISITMRLKEGQMPGPYYTSIEKYIADHHVTNLGPKSIRAIVSTIRASKLPDPKEKASSGSFFKNIYLNQTEAEKAIAKGYPVFHGKDGYKINSGWFIEQAGFAGKLLHGMRVCDTAALVLINESATSYEDLAKARNEIINKIYDKYGYWLEQEPNEIINTPIGKQS